MIAKEGLPVLRRWPPSPGHVFRHRALADLDPNLSINHIRTMQQQIDLSFDQERAVASLAGLFGVVALILAAIGLYGVTAYAVAQRTGEIGIRMALGANRGNVLGLVLLGALLQLCFGLVIGIPVALAGGRLISNQLYGVKSHDPAILALAGAILGACALLAAFLPARRAASVDPMRALRTE